MLYNMMYQLQSLLATGICCSVNKSLGGLINSARPSLKLDVLTWQRGQIDLGRVLEVQGWILAVPHLSPVSSGFCNSSANASACSEQTQVMQLYIWKSDQLNIQENEL